MIRKMPDVAPARHCPERYAEGGRPPRRPRRRQRRSRG